MAPYDGPVREAVNAYKERAQLGLADALGAALARAAWAASAAVGSRGGQAGVLLLVPVPTARVAVRRRGHDPVGRLAKVAAAHLRRVGHPAACLPVLRQVRRLSDQAALSASGRWINLAGALTVPPRLARLVEGAHVLIIDDVITTGATLAEAARALSEAGARAGAAAVIAATERRYLSSAGTVT